MGRLSNSWSLATSSWKVLSDDKELAVIPVASFFATAATMVLVGGGVWLTVDRTLQTGTVTGSTAEYTYQATPLTFVVGAVGYLLITFVVTFFAAALVAGAHERLCGGNPTLGSAFGRALARIGPIFLWSLLTGTVGLILQSLRERAGFLADLVLRGIGMAWEVVTWLAVPVVVVEGTGPISSLKRAAGLFKKTWGENIIAQAGFGLLGFVIVLPGLIIATLIGLIVPVAGIAVGALFVAVVSVILSALNGIFRTALYMYASGEATPDGFTQAEMATAFAPKRRTS